MRFPRLLVTLSVLGAAACGPTYVVQSPPGSVPQRAPEPPRVPPMEVSIVRADENRVLIQTSRQAYIAVFEVVPGRGVSLVYPAAVRPRNVQQTGLTWVNVSWTIRPDYRFASSDTRYIYAVASDTPLRLDDDDYNAYHMQRALGSAYWSSSPNVAVRAIQREFVRSQPDEWWGEDMTSMPLMSSRVTVAIRLARVFCPDGSVFDVRDDMIDRVWCPARRGGPRPGERPGAAQPDSVFSSNGRRVARRMDPSSRTPIFRVPAGTQVGQQQGQPTNQPDNPRAEPAFPRTQPQDPPVKQPPSMPSQDPNAQDKDHHDNGRRAHGDPRDADPRGNGNGYGNGGRNTPSTQPPTQGNPPAGNPPASNPPQSQPQQQGQPQNQPGNNGQGNGNNGNHGNSGNAAANAGNDHGKSPNDAKPDHADAPKSGIAAILKNRGPQAKQDKKPASDSTADKDKKKP
ncbi:MAG TPA: hypothetical protein VJW73_19485 [Gemmatimonadaceae bacterium]|nr:hypothetical protein [Gemmatimonadaceae bacterium]